MSDTQPTKVCKKCRQEKPFSEFHILLTGRNGLHPECKECKNARNRAYNHSEAGQKTNKARIKKFRASPEGKEYRRKEHDRYRKTENGKKALYDGMKRFRKRNPEKIKAVQFVDDRIYAGKLERGTVCSNCQATGVKIEAHHWAGYEREHWLDIVWLCFPCHKATHRLHNVPTVTQSEGP
jgi:hypothetical protein